MTGSAARARSALPTSARMVAVVGLVSISGLGLATSASAATGDSVAVNHSSDLTVHTSQQLTVQASAAPTCALGLTKRTVTVTLTGPSGSQSQTSVLATSSKPCSKQVTLTPSLSSPARNGAYTVTLRNGSASRTTTATLDVGIPPSKVENFHVAADETDATFAWSANPEPDVTAYFITTSSGKLVKPVRASVACASGSTCSTRDDLGPSAAGHTETFVIHAIRCGVSCDQHIAGPSSSPASATFTAAHPLPSPPAPVRTQPAPVTSPSSPSSPSSSAASSSPVSPSSSESSPAGQSSAPASVGSSSPPQASASSAPAGVSQSPSSVPSSTASSQAAAASSSSSSSGGDWAVRAVAIVLVLITLALFVRALAVRASTS